ncbi:type II secretion system protein GspM [Undibacterium sp. SXout7W]|uniref:type II secretion system protein GspM n=1 Tax=Undibacterium sp. SXout7W TaxID=3413049 RepID=UPI003BF07340
MQLLLAQWMLFWQQREPRERKTLIAGGLALALMLIYLLLLNPALSGRAQLQEKIPQLRQQLAQMNLLSSQQAALAAGLAEQVPAISKEQLELALARRGVKAQSLAVTDGTVRLQISTVAYQSLMELLTEWQKASRLTVEEARLAALPEVGMVSASLTLKQQKNGQ